MSGEQGEGRFPRAPRVQVWDSHYGSATQAFDHFRQAVSSAFMPWTPERAEPDFEGRVQSASLENGTVGRVNTSPIVAKKTKANIANSPIECIHGNYIYSGEILIELGGRSDVARKGDLILHHSHLPVVLNERPDAKCDNLAFVVPFSNFKKTVEGAIFNAVVPARRIGKPLAACFDMMAESLHRSSCDELSALLDASISLIPLTVAPDLPDRRNREAEGRGLSREILRFVDQNLADPNLSPSRAAQHFDVSVRYVHKLFAQAGTTFSAYVTAERLERVRSDLLANAGRREPISAHAFRWGFSDISTFNRGFKRRFGCSPRRFRE